MRKKDLPNYHYIDRTDNVTYRQYANSSSSYDSAYTDIPGATEAAYTVDAAYAGKYLRVKVTSENTVSSTQKKSSYGGTQSVAPLGPVTLKGQYKLAGIELADKNVTLSVGSKITPSVQVPVAGRARPRTCPRMPNSPWRGMPGRGRCRLDRAHRRHRYDRWQPDHFGCACRQAHQSYGKRSRQHG
ncbi:MAG: hypothetical protein ACLU0O_08280 [Collinsella sp.]